VQVEEVDRRRGPGEQCLGEGEQGAGVDVIRGQSLGEGIKDLVTPAGERAVVGESLEKTLESMPVGVDRPGQQRHLAPVFQCDVLRDRVEVDDTPASIAVHQEGATGKEAPPVPNKLSLDPPHQPHPTKPPGEKGGPPYAWRMALYPSCGTDNPDDAMPRLHEAREIFTRLGARS
jgi:hypothetical protein